MIAMSVALVLIPIAAACLLLVFGTTSRAGLPRWVALGSTVAALLVVGTLANTYYHDVTLGETAEEAAARAAGAPIAPPVKYIRPWLTFQTTDLDGFSLPKKIELHIGLDGVSVAMMVLTALLSVSCVLISWNSIRDREAEFYVALLFLEAGLFGVFCAFDLILFYVFFEFTLVPLFFLIAMWGGPQRRRASIKFFLYTLAGSLVTLLGVVMLVSAAANAGVESPTSLPELSAWVRDNNPLSPAMQTTLFLMLAAGFAIKVPVFPFHTWCRWRTSRRPPRAACYWPACCSSSAPTASFVFACRCYPQHAWASACRSSPLCPSSASCMDRCARLSNATSRNSSPTAASRTWASACSASSLSTPKAFPAASCR
jgi:NADH-quinone oxidoreductase subunit M